MIKPAKIGLAVMLLVFLSGGLAMALDVDSVSSAPSAAELRLTKACQREVIARSPHGHRELKTIGYDQESSVLGVAKGSVKTSFMPHRWSKVTWTCRVHPVSARVLRVEFGWTTGGSRLMAAAFRN